MKTLRIWIEAMRLRTLPVSLAGVVMAAAMTIADGCFDSTVIVLCLIFATLAQISSNFANEYFDFRDGLDAPGREGPRRGVTEGDITPRAMLIATIATLAVACLVGLVIASIGGWWLIIAGVLIAVGVMAYSMGKYAFSRNCLGEVAVIIFFGIVPVCLTYYVSSGGQVTAEVFLASLSIGLLGSNVLLVNNIRDAREDSAVGKHTLANTFGIRFAQMFYLLNGIVAVALMMPLWLAMRRPVLALPGAWLALHIILWMTIRNHDGRALNPLLGKTAILVALYALMFLVATIFVA